MAWVLGYIGKAATAWSLGFLPWFEIYLAVPAAIALGLDYASAVFWSVLGNFTPVLLIVFGYERLLEHERLKDWLTQRRSERLERLVNRYGTWFILVITPWLGVWIVAATARALGMNRTPLLVYSFVSIAVHAVAIAAGIALGLEALAQP